MVRIDLKSFFISAVKLDSPNFGEENFVANIWKLFQRKFCKSINIVDLNEFCSTTISRKKLYPLG